MSPRPEQDAMWWHSVLPLGGSDSLCEAPRRRVEEEDSAQPDCCRTKSSGGMDLVGSMRDWLRVPHNAQGAPVVQSGCVKRTLVGPPPTLAAVCTRERSFATGGGDAHRASCAKTLGGMHVAGSASHRRWLGAEGARHDLDCDGAPRGERAHHFDRSSGAVLEATARCRLLERATLFLCPRVPDVRARARRRVQGHAEPGSRRGTRRLGWVGAGALLAALLAALLGSTDGWVAMSDKGYTIKHNLVAEAQLKVDGDLTVHGVMISKMDEHLACTAERTGSLRWNDRFFESCDGVTDWQPVKFCSRTCDVNAQAVPCGVAVKNECGDDCEQTGTGTNMRQCILNVAYTQCGKPVNDMCGNICGMQGQFACDAARQDYGGMVIRSLEGSPSSAGYEFTTGNSVAGSDADTLFLYYKNLGGVSQALTRMYRIAEEGASGLHFAKPPGKPQAAMRVSMFTELTGEYIQLGKDKRTSNVFFDGVIDKECPMTFNSGESDGNLTRLCLETPSAQQTLTLPNRSGFIVTSGNREDIATLPGLMGDDVFVYTGQFRDLGGAFSPPPQARFECPVMNCSAPSENVSAFAGPSAVCAEMDYAAPQMDLYRVFYTNTSGFDFTTGALAASAPVRALMADAQAEGRSRMELALLFMRLQAAEAGHDLGPGTEWEALLTRHTFGNVTNAEVCFACCCGAMHEGHVASGVCPKVRRRPQFCVGGDRDGTTCETNADCVEDGWCTDDPTQSCFEGDHGFECFDLGNRPNYTTTVNFTTPSKHQRLQFPDASGTVITTGNLQDVTRLGTLEKPLVGQSTNTTTTTLQFARCAAGDESCGVQQVSDTLVSNTLLIPSSADGIMLSTGNLEDVTLDSGAMSGLRITGDLHLTGLLSFSDATDESGFLLPPRAPSREYSSPSGRQRAGNRSPGQLSVQVGASFLTLEVEPRSSAARPDVAFLTVPATDGIIVSSGNLEDVTAEVGAMTSLSVGGGSYMEGGLTIGGEQGVNNTLALVGEVGRSIVFEKRVGDGDARSTTTLAFQSQVRSHARITFPAASGRVVTTGNLPDIAEFSGAHLNISGESHLHGAVRLGADKNTPVVFSGFLEGDVVMRTAPRYPDDGLDYIDIPDTNSWGVRRRALCTNGVPSPLAADPHAAFPEYARFAGWRPGEPGALVVRDFMASDCRSMCEPSVFDACGLVLTSRFKRAYAQVAVGEGARAWLAAVPRETDACFPRDAASGLANFSTTPALRSRWARDADCQAAALRDVTAANGLFAAQWGSADAPALAALELLPVTCGGAACAGEDAEPCAVSHGCTVVVRSHATGAYLGTARGAACPVTLQNAGGSCAAWRATPAAWLLTTAARPTSTAVFPGTVDGNFFRLTRQAACVELAPGAPAAVLQCEGLDSDGVQAVSALWGDAGGACGAYSLADGGVQCADAADLEAALQAACAPGGCSLQLDTAGLLHYASLDADGPSGVLDAAGCGARAPRLLVTALCSVPAALVAFGDRAGLAPAAGGSAFHLHSDYSDPTRTNPFAGGLHSQCAIVETAGTNCELQRNEEFDVHFFVRDEGTTLVFDAPSDQQTMWFPDASGKVVSTGNLEDITQLDGLKGTDSIVYRSGFSPNDPVTILDFAAIGTALEGRKGASLPTYADEDGVPVHPWPAGYHHRITFPDATGTVITTGNTDDLVLKTVNLEGLLLEDEANFGEVEGDATVLNFGASSRISGCLNFVLNADDDAYTQLCAANPTGVNRVRLPDVSGTVLTTGNLLALPDVTSPEGNLQVGGRTAAEGLFQLGARENTTTVQFFSWIDGDAGMVFAGAGVAGNNVVQLNAPHMSGIDKAIRAFLSAKAKDVAVDVQGVQVFRTKLPGTRQLNESVCFSEMTAAGVSNSLDVGYLLLKEELARPSRLTGTPYAARAARAAEVWETCTGADGAPTCEGPAPSACACVGPGESLQTGWKVHAAPWEVDASPAEPACASGGWGCAQGEAPCNASTDAGCAFDAAEVSYATTGEQARYNPGGFHAAAFNSTLLAPPALPPGAPPATGGLVLADDGVCVLGLRLAEPTSVELVRLLPRRGRAAALVGARLQGSACDPSGAAGNASNGTGAARQGACARAEWVDLFEIEAEPVDGEWTSFPLLGGAARFAALRLLGPACGPEGAVGGVPCRCDVAEMEWHLGPVTQQLSTLELGARSYVVDATRVDRHPTGAMVLKCAMMRWLPAYLVVQSQEVVIPEASGVLLTTGNLRDITADAGALGSLGVSGDLLVGGTTSLGSPTAVSTLAVHAAVQGRFPLEFTEAGPSGFVATFHVADPTADSFVALPDASGTIVTTGSLPGVLDQLEVVGGAAVHGDVAMLGNVQVGRDRDGAPARLRGALAGAFALGFTGGAPTAPGAGRISLGVSTATGDRLLTLPDASGTVVTSGNLPDVLEGTTFVGDAELRGGAVFSREDVVIGARGAGGNLNMHAPLHGCTPLRLEGRSSDARTISLSVEEPAGRNMLILPDVTGTVITTGNFPEEVERLQVLGAAQVEGGVQLHGPRIVIGDPETGGRLEVRAALSGRFPLVFSDADESGRSGSTTWEVTPPTGTNIISFPDTSGTVVTTGNLPSTIVMGDEDYALQARALVASVRAAAFGCDAAEIHDGSFVFADASSCDPPAGLGAAARTPGAFRSRGANSFNVRALGGAKIVTGHTASGRELGVALAPGASGWSVLSDAASKANVSRVDPRAVLRTLVDRVPIATWAYELGGGGAARHMGPMAQDLYAAFDLGGQPEHVAASDVDGVALAALQGARLELADAQGQVDALDAATAAWGAGGGADKDEKDSALGALGARVAGRLAANEAALARLAALLGQSGDAEGRDVSS